MRQRKIKNLDEKIESLSHLIVDEPAIKKGSWKSIFENDNPLFLEIGCGKGRFITENAKTYKDKNFIGIEGQRSVLYRALNRAKDEDIANIRFVAGFVDNMADWFERNELDGIYLNFSDPWPKARHEKRRLTYGNRLLEYARAIKAGGFIQFKTDNDDLFEYTLEQVRENRLAIRELSRDLHKSEYFEKNICTEYEEKFSLKGKNINYMLIGVGE